jgi:hypothetical protein
LVSELGLLLDYDLDLDWYFCDGTMDVFAFMDLALGLLFFCCEPLLAGSFRDAHMTNLREAMHKLCSFVVVAALTGSLVLASAIVRLWRRGGLGRIVAVVVYVAAAEFNRQTAIGDSLWKLEFLVFVLVDILWSTIRGGTPRIVRDIWSFAASGSGISVVALNCLVVPVRLLLTAVVELVEQINRCEDLESSKDSAIVSAGITGSVMDIWEDGGALVQRLFVEFLSRTLAVPCEAVDLLSALFL